MVSLSLNNRESAKMSNKNEFKPGIYLFGECNAVVTIENGCYHISISHPERLPTYDELKEARYKFAPDFVYMAQIFPPMDEFVNLHPFCLHLYEIARRNE